MDLGTGRDAVRVGGVGGCYGPADFERPSKNLQGYAKRHYTQDEIELLRGRGKIDILLVHDAPAGVRFERHRQGAGWVSTAAGLDQLVAGVRPKVCFFGHHHTRVDGEVAGVRCIGLNKVAMPGNLMAIDLEPRGGAWSILGEWPKGPIGFEERPAS
jgi:Icc-related predicted phosphoesterase